MIAEKNTKALADLPLIAEKRIKSAADMPPMATIKEAAEKTPFSYYMLRKMCLTGQVACIRSSRKIYINLDSLATLMNGGN